MTSTPCTHPSAEAFVEFARLQDDGEDTPHAFSASVRLYCSACAEPFRWIGAPVGLSPRSPMVSVDGQELRAPLAPVSAPPGFGEGGPGYSVAVRP